MADNSFLPKEKLNTLLEALSKKLQVFVPVLEGDVVLFRRFASGVTLCLPGRLIFHPRGLSFRKARRCLISILKKTRKISKRVP